jgi:hypothetical protein
MGSTQPLATTLRRFIADLPILAGIWIVATFGVSIVLSVVDGRILRDELALAVTFLPLAVPLSPALWLWRMARMPDRTLPAVAAVFGWFIVTVPLAIWAGTALGSLLGVD